MNDFNFWDIVAMKCNSNDNQSELFSISNQVWFKFVLIYVLFFQQRKNVFYPFNMFCPSYHFGFKSPWWFIYTYVCIKIIIIFKQFIV